MSDKKAFNRAHAEAIFDSMIVDIEKFTAKPKLHPKVTFLGYADLNITTLISGQDVGLSWRLRGIQCKILNGAFRLDMPSDEVVDAQGAKTYPPHYFPLSGELRAVLEAKVAGLEDARIVEAVGVAAQLAAAATPAPEDTVAPMANNPFRANA